MISIIMGIYNCADTLKEAIESIFTQTYTDWELIMCDDGSKDNTYEIAQEYVKNNPERKIKLLKHEVNEGLNKTLNDCLAVAQGEYIARMDADDISLPERLKKQMDALQAEPELAIVSCPMIHFDENGDWATGTCNRPYPEKKDLVFGTIHPHAPCLVKAEAYRAVNGYSTGRRLLRVEDWHLWIKMYSAGYNGKNLSEPLYKMRDDQNATKRRKFKFRLNEAYVSRIAVREFNLPKWMYLYSIRFILVGLLPAPIYNALHRNKIKSKV